MTARKYTVVVSVSIINSSGDHLGTMTKHAVLEMPMTWFQRSVAADSFMKGELNNMVSIATGQIEDCFGHA